MRRINRAANRELEPGRLPAAGPRAARPPDALAPHRLAAAGAAAGRAPVGPGGHRVLGRRDRAARVRRGRRPPRPGRCRRRSTKYADPDHPTEKQVAAAAVDAIKALLLESARLRQRRGAPRARAAGDPDRARAVLPAPDVPLAREARAPAADRAGRPRAARGLPASARAGARGRRSAPTRQVAKPSAPMPNAPPTIGTRRAMVIASRLPATRVISSEVTSADSTRSRSGSWTGAVAIAIGGAGSLRSLISSSTELAAEHAGEDRVADPRVVEVVAAQVRDPGHHPGLDQRQTGDVRGDGDGRGEDAAERR